MGAGADLEVVIGLGDSQFAEEDPGHGGVVVLPRVDQTDMHPGSPGVRLALWSRTA